MIPLILKNIIPRVYTRIYKSLIPWYGLFVVQLKLREVLSFKKSSSKKNNYYTTTYDPRQYTMKYCPLKSGSTTMTTNKFV